MFLLLSLRFESHFHLSTETGLEPERFDHKARSSLLGQYLRRITQHRGKELWIIKDVTRDSPRWRSGGGTTRPLPRDGGAEELRGDPTVGPHPKVWTIGQE